jgi:chemotaxis protein methyltransferase CheR
MAVADISQLTPHEFEQFQALIFKLSGIRVPENKVTLLSNRIRRRLRATKITEFDAYLKHLRSREGKTELEGFLSVVTTNETSFFRTDKHFEWLQSEFIDGLRKQALLGKRPKRIRVWSAACSTGQEPYSIAMCLADSPLLASSWTIEVLGTDISEQALEKARAGIYGPHDVEKIPEKQRKRCFRHANGSTTWEVSPAIKQMVTLLRHNLMDPLPQPAFDCVFVRNVLIYFNRESKQTVIDHLVRSMADGGYLVVGPSEGIYDMLGMLQKRSTFLYQKV